MPINGFPKHVKGFYINDTTLSICGKLVITETLSAFSNYIKRHVLTNISVL